MTGPRKAMILAAGLGTRMAPLTATRPKPLIELKGKALIDYAIDRFVAQGVNFIVVNVHYLADQLVAHLSKRILTDGDHGEVSGRSGLGLQGLDLLDGDGIDGDEGRVVRFHSLTLYRLTKHASNIGRQNEQSAKSAFRL